MYFYRIDAEMLINEFNVPPGPIYKELIQGRSIQSPDGRMIKSEMVVGKPRRPRKVVILGDTYDPSAIIDQAMDADVLIHEATCSDEDLQVALSKGHSTAGMAGDFAKKIRAKHLILNHFSPRGFRPNEYEESKNIRVILQQARDKFQSDFVYAARVKAHKKFLDLFNIFRIFGDFLFHYHNKSPTNYRIIPCLLNLCVCESVTKLAKRSSLM